MKGLILEIEEKHSIVLTDQGVFIRVLRRQNHATGGVIECDPDASETASDVGVRARRRMRRHVLAAAACIVAILGSWIFCDRWETADYTLYVDINPGIRLSVNSLGHTIDAQPVNQDGVAFLETVDVKGELATGLQKAAEAAEDQGLIQSGGIGIAVVTADDAKVRKVTDVIEKALPLMKLSFVYLTPEEEQEAYAVGVAPVRWKMAQIVAERYPRLDVETAMRLEKNYLFGLYRGDESYPPKY